MSLIKNDRTHLPFVEKFRPKQLDDVMSHNDIIKSLKNFLINHNIPHLMFYGPPGTGKTSTIEAFVRELYGDDNVNYMTMNINASEERGIEIVRNKIKTFVSHNPIHNITSDIPKYKIVILDEADQMTLDAQAMLKQVIELYTPNARFCLICNCIKKINPAIQSRCTTFKFSPLDYESVKKKIKIISNEFNINIKNDGIDTIWKLSEGDMRKVMHMLQVISINEKKIDSDIITSYKKYPTIKDSKTIYNILIKGNISKSLKIIKNLIKNNSYSLTDIIKEMTYKIVSNTINNKLEPKIAQYILSNLKDIEMNVIVTGDTEIQLCNLISVFTLATTNQY